MSRSCGRRTIWEKRHVEKPSAHQPLLEGRGLSRVTGERTEEKRRGASKFGKWGFLLYGEEFVS